MREPVVELDPCDNGDVDHPCEFLAEHARTGPTRKDRGEPVGGWAGLCRGAGGSTQTRSIRARLAGQSGSMAVGHQVMMCSSWAEVHTPSGV